MDLDYIDFKTLDVTNSRNKVVSTFDIIGKGSISGKNGKFVNSIP